MTNIEKRIKLEDILGNKFYDYNFISSNYTPLLNSTITLTCTVTNVYGDIVTGKSIQLYKNGVAVDNAKTTNNNGVVTWTINCTNEGLQTFKVGYKEIEVFVDNKANTNHTHNQYLTSHQDISGKANISDLSTVATTGSYNDLTNKPNIPSEVTVDSSLSDSSSNPVENKVIKSALDNKSNTSHTHSSSDVTDNSAYTNIGTSANSTQKQINNGINSKLGEKAVASNVYSKSETYTKSEITSLISNTVSDLDLFEIVEELPSTNIKDNRLYLIVNDETITNNSYDIYLRVDNSWEQLDKLDFDIGNYYNKTEINTLLDGKVDTTDNRLTNARTPTSHSHGDISNTGAIGSTANKPIITGSNGKLTTGSFGTTANTFAEGNHTHNYATSTDISTHNSSGSAHTDIRNTIDGLEEELDDKSDINHTHTKSEITDFPTLHTVATSGNYNDLTNKPTIPNVSEFITQSAITTHNTDNTAHNDIRTILNSKADSSDIPTKTSDLTNDSNFLTSHQDISGKVDKVTGKGLSTNDFTNTYKDSLDNLSTTISNAVGNLELAEVVTTLPTSNIKTNRLYLVANTQNETENKYDIYLRVNNNWEKIDSLEFDITNYLSKTEASNTYQLKGNYLTSLPTHNHNDTYYTKTETDGLLDDKADTNDLSTVATSGSYNDLSNKPSIPSDVSELTDTENTLFTPKSHTHTKSQITDFPTIPSASNTTPSADTTNGTVGSSSNYAKADHTHPKSNIYAESTHTHNSQISFGTVDDTSTSTVFTATVDGLTSLTDGTTVMLKNGVVTSEAGFTINVNGLGAKPVYSNLASATQDTTIFNINYTMLFVYDSTRVDGGCWVCYRGYDSNTNTIGYQIRTNSIPYTATDKGYRYRLWLETDNGKYMPVNTSTSTNATANRSSSMNTREFWIGGNILYNGTNGTTNAEASMSATNVWKQYTLALGYSFNNTGSALVMTYPAPVYMVAKPTSNGKARLNTPYYTQTLPSSEDGLIYIYLGHMYSATSLELALDHPVYEYKNGSIRLYTAEYSKSEIDTLLNGKSDTNHTHNQYLTSHQDITGKEDKSNKVTSWSSTTTDTNYPSEKLVKDSLDSKSDSGHTHNYASSNHNHGIIASDGGLYKIANGINKNVVTDNTGKIAIEDKYTHPSTHPSSIITDSNTHNNIGNTSNTLENIITNIDNKLGSLANVDLIEVTSTLPTASSSTLNKLYLIAESSSATNDNYEIYVTVRTGTSGNYSYAWEKVDTARIDLSNYLTTTNAQQTYVAKENGKGLFSGSYNDLTDKPNIPTQITVDDTVTQSSSNPVKSSGIYSALQTKQDDLSQVYGVNNANSNSIFYDDDSFLYSINDRIYHDYASTNELHYLKSDNTDVSFEDIALIEDIPTIPTNVSSFTNDSGYLTANDKVGTFGELQSLINNASSGSTIRLDKDYKNSGNESNLTLNKSLTIQGNGHTIDADSKSRILTLTGNTGEIIINGTTFMNGLLNDGDSSLIIPNGTEKGGAINGVGYNGKLTINNCFFYNNRCNNDGGAVYSKKVNVYNSIFLGNRSVEGGAIYCENNSSIIKNCIFKNNLVNVMGADIYCQSSELIIYNCDVYKDNEPYNLYRTINKTYLTDHQDISGKANTSDLGDVAFSNDYTNLDNLPSIPSDVSELTDNNDTPFTPKSHNHSINEVNNLQTTLDNKLEASDLLNLIYPIGSIYMSMNATNPTHLFGGNWWKLEDRFLLASSSNYTTGTTGGEATHTLTINEMPSHTHEQDAHTHIQNPHTHTQDAHTHTQNQHSHIMPNSVVVYNASLSRGLVSNASSTKVALNSTLDSAMGVNSTTATNQNTTATNQNTTATNQDTTATNQDTGGGQAHNNMPPYLSVNMWQRLNDETYYNDGTRTSDLTIGSNVSVTVEDGALKITTSTSGEKYVTFPLSLTSSQNFIFEFEVAKLGTNQHLAVYLKTPTTATGFWVGYNVSTSKFSGGVGGSTFDVTGTVTVGDKFRIKQENGVISFYQNDNLLYTQSATLSGTYTTGFYTNSGRVQYIKNIKLIPL